MVFAEPSMACRVQCITPGAQSMQLRRPPGALRRYYGVEDVPGAGRFPVWKQDFS
jgi:hypothetical protein